MAAAVGEQGDQGGLAHVGGFAAHVGARDDQHSVAVVQVQVVGDEGGVLQVLHHRVAALGDGDARLVTERRRIEAQALGAFGEIGEDVQLAQRPRGVLQGREILRHVPDQLLVEMLLTREGAALGAQGPVLELLELRGDEPLRVLQRLAADVLGGGVVGLGAADLDVVAMHPVVTHLEGADPGAFTLAFLDLHQVVAGVFAQACEFVQLAVVACPKHAAVAYDHGRVVDDGALQGLRQLRVGADALGNGLEVGQFQGGQVLLELRQGQEGVAQSGQVPRPRGAESDPREDALDVADAAQAIMDGFVMVALEQGADAVPALAHGFGVAQRSVEPAPQQASAHGGGGAVHDRGEGVLLAAAQVGVDFQVAAAGRVHGHTFLPPFAAEPADVGEVVALGVTRVLQQAAGGLDGQGQVLAAEATQVAYLELARQQSVGGLHLEQPGALAAYAIVAFQQLRVGEILADQDLRGLEPLKLGAEGFRRIHLLDHELAGGHLQRRDPERALMTMDRQQQVIPAFLQQRLIAQGARRNDAHHLAVNRALGGFRVACLFTDGNGVATTDQARDVALRGVIGDPRHGYRLAGGLAPGGQGDVQHFRGTAGVLVEQFVEVAHAVEQQLVRVLGLELQILAHHGGVTVEIGFRCGHDLLLSLLIWWNARF